MNESYKINKDNIQIICHNCEINKIEDENKIMKAAKNIMKRKCTENSTLYLTFSAVKDGKKDCIKCNLELNINNGKSYNISGIGANCVQAAKSGKDAAIEKLAKKLNEEKL